MDVAVPLEARIYIVKGMRLFVLHFCEMMETFAGVLCISRDTLFCMSVCVYKCKDVYE